MTASSQWLAANWASVVGIPEPDAGPWMLRDTPLDLGTLRVLKGEQIGGEYVQPVDDRMKHVGATKTRPETAQHRYETGVRPGNRHESVFDAVADLAPVSRDVFAAFAADPAADLYAVEVFPKESVTNDIASVESAYGIDVCLVGVGSEEPAGYPGRFVEVDDEELRDPYSPVMRAIPGGDLLILSGRIEYSHVAPVVADRAEARVTVFNPDVGAVEAVIRDELLLTGGDESSVDGDQVVLDRFCFEEPDEGQATLPASLP